MFSKQIQFDRQDREYSAYLDGEYVGSFATREQAQSHLDQLVYNQLVRG